jgi:glutamyl-tRNA synthetase
MTDRFDLGKLTPSPAAINFTKLDHFNGTHIRLLEDADLEKRVRPFLAGAGLPVDDDILRRIAPLIKGRMTTLDEAVGMAGFFFRPAVEPVADELIGKGLSRAQSRDVLRQSRAILEPLQPFDAATLDAALRELVERMGLSAGQVFGILRAAVTGQKISPPLFESMEIIGRDAVLRRLQKGEEVLGELP